MKFFDDAPFKGSHGVYFTIKMLVIALGVLLGAAFRVRGVVMARERVSLYDTTLRDGAQTQGVDFSVEDKRTIALALDALGIDYVEGGWPGANPTDTSSSPTRHRSRARSPPSA